MIELTFENFAAVRRGKKGGRMLAMNLKIQLSTEFRMQNYDRADFRKEKGGRMLAMNLKSQLATKFRMQNNYGADF